ncbi:MAG: transporter substrate-binding domain-containing protein [Eubacteriales bacterium]|nr:transporter substrate-binding domain-containing protein [Eubacteriales bacterium]
MKKLLAMVLAMVMVMCMAACGNAKSAEATWESQLGKKGVLRVGMAADYPPYESYDANGNVVGFDADMAKKIADYMGVELEIVPMDFDTIITAVAAKTIDAGISCFSYNEERAKSVLFTNTYMTSAQACYASTQYGINSMEDLKGGIVGAGNGTTGMDVANELSETYGYTTQAGENAIMAEALKAGAIQGVITEKCVADSYIASDSAAFKMIKDDLTVEEIKGITALGNDALLNKLNEAIAAIMKDEAKYNQLIIDWFG